MKKEERLRLLEHYFSTKKEGKEPYLDANEIEGLLDYLEDIENYECFEDILALGLKLHPNNSDILIRKCRQFLYNEQYTEALHLLDEIIDADDQDQDLIRLECFCGLDQYTKVLERTEELIAGNSYYLEEIFEYITPILNDLEMTKEARDYVDRGLTLFPDNLLLKNELSYVLETEGDIVGAIAICNEMIDTNPYSYDFWFTLGRLHSMVGDFDKAIEAFDFALTCDDSDFELKILKAYCLYMNESYEKALEEYADISNDPEIAFRIKPLMADCYMKLDDFEKAYELLSKIIDSDNMEEDGAGNYINYIRCCLETDRRSEASEMLLKASKLYPDNIRVLSWLALNLLENGLDKKAIELTNRIFRKIENIEKSTEEQNLNAPQDIHLPKEGKTSLKSIEYYKQLLKLDPNTPYIHMSLAIAYMEMNDLSNFSKHIKLVPKEEVAQYIQKIRTMNDPANTEKIQMGKIIPPADLVKDFLNNKDNSN